MDDPTSWSTHVDELEEGTQRRVVLSPAILSRLDGLHLEARIDADHAANVENGEVLEERPSDILAQLWDEGAEDVQGQKRQRGGDEVEVEKDLFAEAWEQGSVRQTMEADISLLQRITHVTQEGDQFARHRVGRLPDQSQDCRVDGHDGESGGGATS